MTTKSPARAAIATLLVCLLFSVSGLTPAGGGAIDTVYKTIGPHGEVRYSDQAPPTNRYQTFSFERLPAAPLPPASPAPTPPTEAVRPAPKRTVRHEPTPHQKGATELYSAEWCGYCRLAKAYLDGHNITYTVYDIDTSAGRAAYKELGTGGVPILVTPEKVVRGFSRASYDALFLSDNR